MMPVTALSPAEAGFPLASPASGTPAEFSLVAGLLAPGVVLSGGDDDDGGDVLWLGLVVDVVG